MSKVYRHKPMAADEYLGHVQPDGKVYEARFGPDRYIGRVEVDTGRIFEARLGPDNYLGRVELDTGKVYHHKAFAPDEYLGRVDGDGKLYRHKPLAADEYLGSMAQMPSRVHAGAALLLLVLPAADEAAAQHGADTTKGKQDQA